MSLAQSFVLALKSLAASHDGRPGAPRQRRRRRRSEAVALVFTLRELFADGGVGRVLDGVDAGRTPPARGRPGEAPPRRALPGASPETTPPRVPLEGVSSRGGGPEPPDGERRFRIARRRGGAPVALPGDEDEAVSLLRRALEWSPRKRSAARFALLLGGGDRTVAVLQNAVNRVKEKKEKRKERRRCFGIALCWACCP